MEKPDPAIEAIRDVRKAISRRFGNDPARLGAHFREVELRFKDRLQHGPGVVDEAVPVAVSAEPFTGDGA